jgi:hypothetical protein
MAPPHRHGAVAAVLGALAALAVAGPAGSAGAGAPPPPPPQAPGAGVGAAAVPDTIIGVWMSRNNAGAPHALSESLDGVSRFVLSASAAAPAARVVVVADGDTRAAVRGRPAAARVVANADAAGDTAFGGPMPGGPGVHLRAWDSVIGLPRWASRLQPHAARYWAYADAVRQVAEEHAAAVAAAAAAGLPAPREPMVLLSDLRDVVFQRDVFADARDAIAAALGGPPPAGLSVLLATLESATKAVGTEPWNQRCSELIFRAPVVQTLAPLPIICSGTTAGGVRAVAEYLAVMTAAMPVMAADGHGAWYGLDQALHIYLLHTAMVAALAAGGGAGTAVGPGLGLAAAAMPPLPAGVLAAYGRVYSNATRDERPEWRTEPAYTALDGLAARLIPARGAGAHGGGGGLTGVLVLPVRHETGPICTFGVVPMAIVWVPGKDGANGVGYGLVAAEDPAAPAAAAAGGGGGGGPPTPTPCAVIHQYDRSIPLRKHFDVVLGFVERDFMYCNAAAPDQCW